MNEFFLANNRSITIGDITIHQLQMYDFDEWSPHAKAIKYFLRTHSDEIYKSLLKDETSHVFAFMSKTTQLEESTLISKAEASESAFIALLVASIKVNDAFFSEKDAKPKRGRQSQNSKPVKSAWFESFQILVSAGHRPGDIMQMTYGAFFEYLKAAQKIQAMKMRVHTNLMRSAQHANAKAFKQLMDELKLSED